MLLRIDELSGLEINWQETIAYCCIVSYNMEHFQFEIRFVFDKKNFINNVFLQIENARTIYSKVLHE